MLYIRCVLSKLKRIKSCVLYVRHSLPASLHFFSLNSAALCSLSLSRSKSRRMLLIFTFFISSDSFSLVTPDQAFIHFINQSQNSRLGWYGLTFKSWWIYKCLACAVLLHHLVKSWLEGILPTSRVITWLSRPGNETTSRAISTFNFWTKLEVAVLSRSVFFFCFFWKIW